MKLGLLRQHSSVISFSTHVMDFILVAVSGYLSYGIYVGSLAQIPQSYHWAIIVSSILASLCLKFTGVYQAFRGRSVTTLFKRVVSAWLILMFLFLFAVFFTKLSSVFSRVWFVEWWTLSLILVSLLRIIVLILLRWARRQGYNRRFVAIVGAGVLGRQVTKSLQQALWAGYEVRQFFDDDPTKHGKRVRGIQVKGFPDNAEHYFRQHRFDEVWVCLPLRAQERIRDVLYALRHTPINVRLVPDVFGLSLMNFSMANVAGVNTLNLREKPLEGAAQLAKLLEDRVLGTLFFILALPVMVVIALLIKFSSPGPVLFKQKRYGLDGKEINVYKFRSMYVHKESDGKVTQAGKSDRRITPIGRFIRRTSLDELPQFYNVIQGRMSIVGPRPHAIAHNEAYKDLVDQYMLRHMVKPGITGWAQVNGFRGETDTLDKMKKRVKYDLYYVENWSLWFDLKIILLTICKGFIGKNAY
jgi:putative colanic acid biosynthesis UDP-glucose lipid carrier transferase